MKNGLIENRNKKTWYLDDKIHKEDGPAVEYSDGTKMWCRHGELHRDNKPAIIYSNGEKKWYQHNKLHRIGGPAIEYTGYKKWYVNGKRHRTDGPAVEYTNNGTKLWFLYDKKYTEEKFEIKVNQMGLKKELFTI